MLLITAKQANNLDKHIIETIGIPRDILIEHAGEAVAKNCDIIAKDTSCRYIETDFNECYKSKCCFDVFFGKGMNGLDSLVAARMLFAMGYNVRLWDIFPSTIENSSIQGAWQYETCKKLGIYVDDAFNFVKYSSEKDLKINNESTVDNIINLQKIEKHEYNFIIDGIFGTGFSIKREIDPTLVEILNCINNKKQVNGYKIISVDLPSGCESDTGLAIEHVIKSDYTITFMAPKSGLLSYPAREFAGEIKLERIGISQALIESFLEKTYDDIIYWSIDKDYAKKLVPKRIITGHKGDYGRISLVGGSYGMAGAICLSAMSAMRCGVGLLYMKVPKDIIEQCLSLVPEALISSDNDYIEKGRSATLIGPGMSDSDEYEKILWEALEKTNNLVLDAQSLNIISVNKFKAIDIISKRNKRNLPHVIMTPHAGEFERMFPEYANLSRISAAISAAREIGAIIVLKGAGTVVASSQNQVYINTSGNNSMAKGGSGDVLSGMIVSFLGQGLSEIDAACLAVYMHGLCGDLAAYELGEHSALPSDFINKIPAAFTALT